MDFDSIHLVSIFPPFNRFVCVCVCARSSCARCRSVARPALTTIPFYRILYGWETCKIRMLLFVPLCAFAAAPDIDTNTLVTFMYTLLAKSCCSLAIRNWTEKKCRNFSLKYFRCSHPVSVSAQFTVLLRSSGNEINFHSHSESNSYTNFNFTHSFISGLRVYVCGGWVSVCVCACVHFSAGSNLYLEALYGFLPDPPIAPIPRPMETECIPEMMNTSQSDCDKLFSKFRTDWPRPLVASRNFRVKHSNQVSPMQGEKSRDINPPERAILGIRWTN